MLLEWKQISGHTILCQDISEQQHKILYNVRCRSRRGRFFKTATNEGGFPVMMTPEEQFLSTTTEIHAEMITQSQTQPGPNVFVCGPISEALKSEVLEVFDTSLHRFIQTLLESLIVTGLNVSSAHIVEDFGNNIPQDPQQVFERDYSLVKDADALIVLLPEQLNGQLWRTDGSFIEIGWATAMSKPTVIVTNLSNERHSYLLRGLVASKAILDVVPLSSPQEVAFRAASLIRICFSTRPATPRSRTIGFCCTSFGFGPVSKLTSIARSCRIRDPNCTLHFVGSNVASQFAQSVSVFDKIIDIDTDCNPGLAVQELVSCDVVVNCLNFEMLRIWSISMPPMVFVDSLAWMWPETVQILIYPTALLMRQTPARCSRKDTATPGGITPRPLRPITNC